MAKLPRPPKSALIYRDKKLYVCLASHPITRGHTVVVWRRALPDLRYLAETDYDYLMDKVDQVRNALIKTLKIKKVYLIYLDEIKHVHWHLVPRYNERGFNVLLHRPKKLRDTALAAKIKANLKLKI